MINSFTLLDREDGASVEYDGPFNVDRDGGSLHIEVPADPDDYAGIHKETAKNLQDRTGDLGVAIADGEVFATGVVDRADIIDDLLLLRLNDGNYADLSEVDIDLAEVDDAV